MSTICRFGQSKQNNGVSTALRRWCLSTVGGLALVGALGTMSPALAQTPAGGTRAVPTKSTERPVVGRAQVELQVVHATNNSTHVDPKLRSLVNNFRFTRLSGFELLSSHPASLAVGQETTVTVAGGRRVKLELLDRNDTEAKVRVRMLDDKGVMLDTTVSIHRNRSFIIAGPNHKDGKLILPVTVRY